MRYRIHFEHADGSSDHIDIWGDTIDEIRATANAALVQRGINLETAWSEEIAA